MTLQLKRIGINFVHTSKNIMRGPKTPFVITFLMTLSFEQSRDL